jgi:hypothetical protein
MRTIIMIATAALLLSGCVVGVRHRGHWHSSHGWHVGYRYRSHHHWNSSGPAYNEIDRIRELKVLPVNLPLDIEGDYTPDEMKEYRAEWPERAAELIAEGVTDGTKGQVDASYEEMRPTAGYYIEITIETLDLGERADEPDPKDDDTWSEVFARGRLVNAGTGELVAEIKFEESSSRTDEPRFEADMTRIGQSLSNWFNSKQEVE